MNRIEEIKKGAEIWGNRFSLTPPVTKAQELAQEHTKVLSMVFEQHAPGYVQYLISKLEIAEKALEAAEEDMKGYDYNVYLERGGDMYEYEEGPAIENVRKALKQIRE